MTGLLVGLATGCAIGCAIGPTLTLVVRQMSRRRRAVSSPPLVNGQDLIAWQFAHHTTAMRQRVSDLADVLAGEDRLLRERLRSFERDELS